METKKYVSRPVEIEAVQFTGSVENAYEIIEWINENGGTAYCILNKHQPNLLQIRTIEGIMDVFEEHWVIRGTEGEFYPCKPSVFERKYSELKPKIEIHINEPATRRSVPGREYLEYYD